MASILSSISFNIELVKPRRNAFSEGNLQINRRVVAAYRGDEYNSEKRTSDSQIIHRRSLLGGSLLALIAAETSENSRASALDLAEIDLSQEPTGTYSLNNRSLNDASELFREALRTSSVTEEERLWTEIIVHYGELNEDWVPDIISRALGNRGNAKSRQGRMEEALDDYSKSMKLAPYAVDPVLNRGVALENLGRFKEAAEDYQAVLKVAPYDPAAWNNLGNVSAALNEWEEALNCYRTAVELSPEFSFAAANYSLALYQVGRSNEAIKRFRSILRKYPEFPDVRAALAVSLYKDGKFGDAETNWSRVEDARYRNREWVKSTRRWPPRLVEALNDFLDLKEV